MDKTIKETLEKYYDELEARGYDIVGIFLFGSQNYGLETENSDVDAKVVVMPSFKNLIHKTNISTSVEFDEGICDIKDLATFLHQCDKCNLNYIEVLYTKYFLMNFKYEADFNYIKTLYKLRVDKKRGSTISSLFGYSIQKFKELYKLPKEDAPTYSAKKAELDEYGFLGKSASHFLRAAGMIEEMIVYNKSYHEVLEDCCFREAARKLKTHEGIFHIEKLSGVKQAVEILYSDSKLRIEDENTFSLDEDIAENVEAMYESCFFGEETTHGRRY